VTVSTQSVVTVSTQPVVTVSTQPVVTVSTQPVVTVSTQPVVTVSTRSYSQSTKLVTSTAQSAVQQLDSNTGHCIAGSLVTSPSEWRRQNIMSVFYCTGSALHYREQQGNEDRTAYSEGGGSFTAGLPDLVRTPGGAVLKDMLSGKLV
jgi:hypothetical protein